MKKILWIAILLGASLNLCSMTVLGVGWERDNKGWWYDIDGQSYPFGLTWYPIDGNWYFFDADGYMVTGFIESEGITYYCCDQGYMKTGWEEIDESWYYFHSDGRMAKEEWIGDYYLLSNGKMAKNQYVGEYFVGSDGKWIQEKAYEWIEKSDVSSSINKTEQKDKQEVSDFTLNNHTRLVSYVIGERLPLNGVIKSSNLIERLQIKIMRNKSEIYSFVTNPNGYEVNLEDFYISKADMKKIQSGDWVLTVTVEDSEYYSETIIEETFEAKYPGLVKFEVSDKNFPFKLDVGDDYDISGIITSNYTISYINAKIILRKDSTIVTEYDCKNNSKYYDISGDMNDRFDFGTLEAGGYELKITVVANGISKEVIRRSFTVQ